MMSNESQRLITQLLIFVSPFVSIAAGIAIGAMWKYHWLGLAVGLNLLTLLIPLNVQGYGRAWAFLLACSGIASAVTYCNCRRSVGKGRSWFIGTSSVTWLIVALVTLFLFEPIGVKSRTIPWSPIAGFLLFGAIGAGVACAVSALIAVTEQRNASAELKRSSTESNT